MTEHQSDSVIQRLDRLERENWYWKRATILLLIVIGSAILMGQKFVNSSVPYQLEAQRFIVKDDKGGIRAELKYDASMDQEGGVSLELYGKNTYSRAALAVSDGFAFLRIYATEERKKVTEQETNEWQKKWRAATTPEESERLLSLPVERPYLWLAAYKGRSELKLTDETGRSAVLGNMELNHLDTGSVEQRPASSLVLFNKDDKVIWKAP